MKNLGAICLLAIGAISCGKKDDSSDAAAKSTMTIKGGASLTLADGVDTASASMTVYEFLFSKNSDCSDAVSVFKSEDGKSVDMMAGPEIGSGELENGTYTCVVMVMKDTITFTPTESTGSCVAGTEYSLDVFRPQGETYKPTGVLPDGTEVEGDLTEQKMAVYISSLSTSTGGEEGSNPFEAPTADLETNGIKLTSALEVTADTVGTMVLDTTGKVDGSNTDCDMQPPKFGFR